MLIKKGYVCPSRGIRQGDPLSPYLFLLCSEGLSSLLKTEAERGKITGVKISRHGPALTHLFFADDSIIFCRANRREAETLMSLLKRYELALGQMVNVNKSSIFFSKNVRGDKAEDICRRLEIMQRVTQGKYLGLPMVITRSKEVFGFIKNKVRKKLSNWKDKFLSPAGRELLLKSAALPTYSMSCFKISKKLYKEISGLMANFWWGKNKEKNNLHWVRWEVLTESKKNGGPGFRGVFQ